MAARGIKAFDENDLPKKQKMGDGGGNVKKNEVDGSPQVPRALSPPAATSEGQIKQSLPSLLSSLAAQKKKQQSEAGKEEGGGRGVVPPAKPPTGRAPPILKSSVSSPTIVKPLSRPSPPPPFHKPSVSSAKPPPTRTHPKPYSPTGSKLTTNAATKPMPPSSSPSSKPASSASNSKFLVGNGKSDVTTTAAGVKRETETKGPGNTTTTNEDRAKDTVSPPRQSVGAWWKQREKDQKEITPKKTQLKQTKSSPPPPPTDPSEPTEYLIPSKVINLPTQSDTPPTQSGNSVAQSDLNRATVLMHYEFGPSHFANNKGAQKVLEDHYEFKPKDLPDPDPSPYEVPQKSQPTKPPRMKRKGAAKDEPHPPRNSETWKKPYAMTPLKNDEEYDVIGAGRGRSPKPPRPAPPPPFVSKARKKSLISPYAVSSVAEESPIRGKILIIWKWQLEVIILSIHFD